MRTEKLTIKELRNIEATDPTFEVKRDVEKNELDFGVYRNGIKIGFIKLKDVPPHLDDETTINYYD